MNFFIKIPIKFQKKKIEKLKLDSFIFNRKSFKKYYRDNKYQKEDKILRRVQKCIYHRKDEKLRIQLNKSNFFANKQLYIYSLIRIKKWIFF